MNTNRIIQVIKYPENLNFSDKDCIKEALSKYPFAQSLQVLKLRWKQRFTLEKLEDDIERLAVYSTHGEIIKNILDQTERPEGSEIPHEVWEDSVKEEVKEEVIEEENTVCEEKDDNLGEFRNDEPEFSVNLKDDEVEITAEVSPEIQNTVENTDIQDRTEEQPAVVEDEEPEEEQSPDSYIDKLGIAHLFSNETIVEENHPEASINTNNIPEKEEVTSENPEKTNIFLETEPKENKKALPLLGKEEKAELIPEEDGISSGEVQVIQSKEGDDDKNNIAPIEKLPFNQWVSLSNQKISVNYKVSTEEKQRDVIAKFIENNPKITTPKKEAKLRQEIEFKKDEIKDIANLMTITLARLYVEQGKYETAITAFKILSLKYPEKSSYFASEIKKIKKIKNSK
ncbi:MAG: hypothetical protein LBQ84_01875 [Flavobacteriaceae bacterium]|jgi:hypothetical protein|nr:hypothetical protein [Flavobacteriaceae bacterium]